MSYRNKESWNRSQRHNHTSQEPDLLESALPQLLYILPYSPIAELIQF